MISTKIDNVWTEDSFCQTFGFNQVVQLYNAPKNHSLFTYSETEGEKTQFIKKPTEKTVRTK